MDVWQGFFVSLSTCWGPVSFDTSDGMRGSTGRLQWWKA